MFDFVNILSVFYLSARLFWGDSVFGLKFFIEETLVMVAYIFNDAFNGVITCSYFD
jgi:hypothetical protein